MDTCLCSTIRRLAQDYDESRAKDVIPAVNCHLRDLHAILAQFKSLTRDVQYRITPNNQRTVKALSVGSVNLIPVDEVYERFKQDIEGFWTRSDNTAHVELRRRLACVVTFLRSKLGAEVLVPPHIALLFQGQQGYPDVRHSGRKYLKISRKLGGVGSILWLPLDIPPST